MDKRRLERKRKEEKGEKKGKERAKLDVARVSGISSLSRSHVPRYTHIIQIVRTYTIYLL